jgi:L-2-hydroxyglutarate oxidase LhgO
MESVDCLVVGAGVVGLAASRALARAGREVIVVESQDCIGSGISSRSSEVIHAGLYYPSNLNKARRCVSGKAMLYEFCRNYHVPHRRCGKLLVAMSEAEVDTLSAIKAQAEANGVTDLVWLSSAEVRALEPALAVHRALLSPSTGIIDSHALMHALRGDAELYGAMVALETPVLSGRVDGGGLILETGGASPTEIAVKVVINAAGLGSQLARPRSHDRRDAFRQDPAPPPRQGELFRPHETISLFAPDLSDPGAGRAGGSSDPRPCRTSTVRTGRGMGGRGLLQSRSLSRGRILYRHQSVLARLAR